MNRIQKGKTGLIVLSIISILLGIGCLIGGVVMIVNGAKNGVNDGSLVKTILLIAFGSLVAIIGLPLVAFGVVYVWTGASLVATKGTVSETNEAAKGNTGNKKCPKCGATNTKDSTVCQVCGEPLE